MNATRLAPVILAIALFILLFAAPPLRAQDQAAEPQGFLPLRQPPGLLLPPSSLQAHPKHRPNAFYASARRRPLTPRDVSMREAVRALGIDKHNFVRCQLKDGSRAIGGITVIQPERFWLSQGISNSRCIRYADLAEAPTHDPAVGEHLANGLKWTGIVGVCVALSPLVIPMIPLMLTGVISD